MTPDQARRYVEILDLYEGDLEALVKETRADKPGLTSALNPHLHDMAHGVATVREKITADAENMTRMIAGMREEWGVAVTYPGLAEVVEWGYSTQAGALEEVELASTAFGAEYRIVRRYVTETEEIS